MLEEVVMVAPTCSVCGEPADTEVELRDDRGKLIGRPCLPRARARGSGQRVTVTEEPKEPSTEKPNPETLALLYEVARDAPEGQLRASDAVDGKIVQVFSAGGVLIGLSSIAGIRHDDNAITAFLVVAVLAFLGVACLSIRAIRSREYFVGIGAAQSWETYWDQKPDDFKHAFVADIAAGWEVNEAHIKAKHVALRRALWALAIETGAIGATLITAVV